jgi:hypothetical protein
MIISHEHVLFSPWIRQNPHGYCCQPSQQSNSRQANSLSPCVAWFLPSSLGDRPARKAILRAMSAMTVASRTIALRTEKRDLYFRIYTMWKMPWMRKTFRQLMAALSSEYGILNTCELWSPVSSAAHKVAEAWNLDVLALVELWWVMSSFFTSCQDNFCIDPTMETSCPWLHLAKLHAACAPKFSAFMASPAPKPQSDPWRHKPRWSWLPALDDLLQIHLQNDSERCLEGCSGDAF